jgi:parallel beta-helix repeat protein
VYGNSYVYNVEVSDLTLDGNNLSTYAMLDFGTLIGRLTLRRVRFINFPGYMIDSGNAANFVFEDCIADGAGNSADSFFVGTSGPFESLLVRRCKFRYLQAGILVADWHAAYVEIDDCDFDMGWWLTKAIFTGSGGTVTYTSNGLADSGASFSGLTAGQIVRVLPARGTGTLTASSTGTLLADTSATFQADGVLRGEIVRTGTSFGVVSKVLSQTELHVEEWLSQTTYQPVQPPVISSAYTVYQVLLGAVTASTGTTITIEHGAGQGGNGGWYGFSGTEVTPAAHTLYEVLTAPPGYGLYLDATVEKAVVTNSRFRRGWCDNVELFGQRLIVANNIAEDDMGEGIVIKGTSGTVLSDGNIVANNLSRHNGASGLYLQSMKNSEVLGNVCEDNGWGCPAVSKVPQIAFWGNTGTSVIGNNAVNTGEFVPQLGIWVSSSTGCTIQGLTAVGHSVADIYVDSENAAAANQILDCTYGTLSYQVSTNGQFLRTTGTGAPSMAASPGSLYSQTDVGGLYLKESGDGTTGWVAVGGGTGTAIGGQGAYASITATVTQAVTAITWTAVSGAPSITLPNDGNTYRLSLTVPYAELSGAAQLIVGIGASASAILGYSQVNVGAASVPVLMRVDLQKITGSGQVVGVYAYCYSSLTVSLEAYANAPCELAAYRVV